MYSMTSPFTPSRGAAAGLAQTYHQIGVETGVNTASPHKLVAMLFDGLLASLTLAQGAMAQGDIEAKCHQISRAVRILDEGLRSALDREQGGPLAADLGDLYGYVSLRLTQANLRNDPALLDECKRLIEPISEAWAAIGPQAGNTR
ncbi:flagellar export chaperone FliS [uncultured Azohydromonas sp.]|jgi:flagellar biosynthetic protein FliS|uniref:flagellar export chaperone FliS n=1 Tax=uncultured Azohydromonas sp. TaxID=487342 RepID=UPI00261027A6|nr:flagellar export chaperone FliS [uncultured Azohydromonas sp.]